MNRERQAIQLMEAAVDLPFQEQQAFVADACKDDSQLLRKVQSLLRAAESESDFLATRCADEPVVVPLSRERIGSYRILREIGRGGMGIVYEAEHDAMQRRVALKVLSVGESPSENQLARFYREARAAGQLHHTNIVPVFEVGSADGLHYYTMQYIEGANLDLVIDEVRELRVTRETDATSSLGRSVALRLLHDRSSKSDNYDVDATVVDSRSSLTSQHRSKPKKSFDSSDSVFSASDSSVGVGPRDVYFRRVAAIALQAAEAVEYAHQNGTLHRDIKPANLMLDTHGIVWVLDFGLAKSGEETLTQTGGIVGTLRYMSPERFDGDADPRSDIYGLGLTLYELCTLRQAFDSTDRASLIRQVTTQDPKAPRQLDRNIPLDLETIILKAIDREPNRRYKSASRLAEDLHLFLRDHPIRARRISTVERVWRICRRNPALSAMTLCIALLLVTLTIGGIGFGLVSQQHARDSRLAEVHATRSSEISRLRNYQLNLSRAESERRSGLPGQGSDALAAVLEATELLPSLGFSDDELREEELKLRSNAIAAMAVVDVRDQLTWSIAGIRSAIGTFSLDYEWFAHADANGTVCVGRVDAAPNSSMRFGDEFGKLRDVLFSENALYLATRHRASLEENDLICVWRLEQPAAPIIQVPAVTPTGCGAFLHDDSFVVKGEGRIEFYSLEDGSRQPQTILADDATSLQLSHQAEVLSFLNRGENAIEIWDLQDQPHRMHRLELSAELHSYAYRADRDVLVAGMIDGSILVWRNGLDRPFQKHNVHQQVVLAARIHPREPLVVTEGYDATVRVFNYVTGTIELQVAGYKLAEHAGFSRDGAQLGFRRGNSLGVWQLSDSPLRTIQHDITGADPANFEVKFHPIHRKLLVTSNSARIEFWDCFTRERLAVLKGLESTFVAFTPDGKSLLASGVGGVRRIPLRVVHDENGLSVELDEPEMLLSEESLFVEIRDDGKFAIVSLKQSSCGVIIDLSGESAPLRLGQHPSITRVSLSNDGKWAATGSWRGNEIRVWNAASGALVTTLLNDSPSTSAAFTPDSKFLLGVDQSGIYLWETETWKPIEHGVTREWHGRVGYTRYSRKGEFLLANRTDYVPQLILAKTMQTIAELETPHLQRPGDYSFSPDNSQLAVRGYLASYVWDLNKIRLRLRDLGLDWPDQQQATGDNNQSSD